MAGHSKFKNIMHRKGAQDAKRAKIFTKIAREIFVAAKNGDPNPTTNPRLRLAISSARAANMPKDKVVAAIKKATSPGDAQNYYEIRYEGYGPDGVAFIVDVLTDNKNRSVAEVRSAFSKSGGSLGETGSVGYMFERAGLINYPKKIASEDEIFEIAIESGANDCVSDDDSYQIVTTFEDFNQVQVSISEKLGEPTSSEISYLPQNTIEVNEETALKIIKLVDSLEDNDDVQKVVGNFTISDEIMQKIK